MRESSQHPSLKLMRKYGWAGGAWKVYLYAKGWIDFGQSQDGWRHSPNSFTGYEGRCYQWRIQWSICGAKPLPQAKDDRANGSVHGRVAPAQNGMWAIANNEARSLQREAVHSQWLRTTAFIDAQQSEERALLKCNGICHRGREDLTVASVKMMPSWEECATHYATCTLHVINEHYTISERSFSYAV